MKAVVYDVYGPPEVLKLAEVPKPVPGSREILVRIHAATVAAGDWRMRKADPFLARLFNGLLRPTRVRVLGFELAGVVEAVGNEVSRFRAGDTVFAFTGFGFGAHAEYICLPEDGTVVPKPSTMSFEEAAAVPVGGMTALAFLRKGGIREGMRVMVYGASGSVGTYAVQLARHFGTTVTGVTSGPNLDLVRSLGADVVLDYKKEGFDRTGGPWDIIFDAVGKTAASRWRSALAPGGVFLSTRGSIKPTREDLEYLKERIEKGELKAVIDRRFSLDGIVEAHRYVEQGHKRGNVVVVVRGEEA